MGDTHKFESRYLDLLVGPYPAQKQKYYDRSPINFVENIKCPVVLFQGLEDKIVPPNQAQKLYDAAIAQGLPAALVMFEGEQHGFRISKNIRRALDGELAFFGFVFGFTPKLPADYETIEIANREALIPAK